MAIKRTLPPSNSALILASSSRAHLTKIREEKDFKQSVVKNPVEVNPIMFTWKNFGDIAHICMTFAHFVQVFHSLASCCFATGGRYISISVPVPE